MFKYVFMFFIPFILIGCANIQTTDSAPNTSPTHLPPTVAIEVNDQIYSTTQGSYCWRNGKNTECINKISPVDLVSNEEPIIVSANSVITLHVNRAPTTESISIENVEDEQIAKLEIKEDTIKTPKEKGIYILIYYAVWEDNGTKTDGDSSYIFKIEVK